MLPLKPHFHLQAARGNATGSVGPSSDERLSELSPKELGRVTLEPRLPDPSRARGRCLMATAPSPTLMASSSQVTKRAGGRGQPERWVRRAATPQAPAGLAPGAAKEAFDVPESAPGRCEQGHPHGVLSVSPTGGEMGCSTERSRQHPKEYASQTQ